MSPLIGKQVSLRNGTVLVIVQAVEWAPTRGEFVLLVMNAAGWLEVWSAAKCTVDLPIDPFPKRTTE